VGDPGRQLEHCADLGIEPADMILCELSGFVLVAGNDGFEELRVFADVDADVGEAVEK
jgi:hypothetical protein